jgi:dihydrofolate reductase
MGGRLRQLSAFMQVSLDGRFADAAGEIGFAHQQAADSEWRQFMAENAAADSVLMFGRITYDLMASWWPTPAAAKAMPEVARHMNALPKVVASRTLSSPKWSNTTLISRDLIGTVRRMKAESGPDITILGSGSIVTQLAAAQLIDMIEVAVNPIALGAGRSFLAGLPLPLPFTLKRTRVFNNGSVVLWYARKEAA